jgi:hypothetical protein
MPRDQCVLDLVEGQRGTARSGRGMREAGTAEQAERAGGGEALQRVAPGQAPVDDVRQVFRGAGIDADILVGIVAAESVVGHCVSSGFRIVAVL